MADLPGIVLLALRMGLVVGLYGFLFWAFASLWRDLRYASGSMRGSVMPTLILKSQADEPFEKQFKQSQFLLGRDPACECHIENDTVSQQHARISFHHNQWWLEDLNSRNGTFLNAKPVDTPAVLTSNDLIRCGSVTLSVNIDPQG